MTVSTGFCVCVAEGHPELCPNTPGRCAFKCAEYSAGKLKPAYPVPAIPLRIEYMGLDNICELEDSFSVHIEQLRYYKGKIRNGPYWSSEYRMSVGITQRARDYLTLPYGMYCNKWQDHA